MKSVITRSARGSVALVAALFISSTSYALTANHIVVFGDSLSDNGNLLAQTGGLFPTAPIYYYGRQSNGLVWNETLAFDLGASLSNYAIVGAQTGTDNIWDGQLPGSPFGGLANQVADYIGGTVDPGALHIIWAGPNNFASIPSDPLAAIAQGVTDIVTAVATLSGAGAGRIIVLNMPDLGLTPRVIDAGLSAQGTFLTDNFNLALVGSLQSAGFGGTYIFDTAAWMRALVANPAAFGLTNVTDACIDPFDPFAAGSCLADPTIDADQYLFWDDLHPTRAAHLLLSEQLRLVPVPAAVWLFGSALLVLAWTRYRVA